MMFGKNHKGEQRKQQMMANLMQSSIQNNSPNYYQPQSVPNAAQTATQKQLLTLTLDQLRPFEGNPRKTKNPAYEDIKASIKARGLDHAPNVTQRPGEAFYTIADGGNTRLQALRELFEETQDPKFWSIDCIFKPWHGEADDVNARIDSLIGHLAENDIRGELLFIEKALGIRDVKALYEEKFGEFFSHRKLAEKLTEQGYPISYSLIARMEQCLVYLYPHIPNVLLSGVGKPQIERLLAIHSNAQKAWEVYQEQISPTGDFDEVWVSALSSMDEEPAAFSVNDFQDNLIGQLTEAFDYQLDYSVFKALIDVEERKLQRLREKQAEIAQQALESQQRLLESEVVKDNVHTEEPVQQDHTSSVKAEQETVVKPVKPENVNCEEEFNADDSQGDSHIPDLPDFSDDEVSGAIIDHFTDLGMVPGVNSETVRSEQAVENGLEFANCGRQPVHAIWKIHPARHHKMEAYSLALDIADELGIAHCIEHIIKEPVDYSFKVKPLSGEHLQVVNAVHGILVALSTDCIETADFTQNLSLSSIDLLGTVAIEPAISDLLLVRLFRLIRVVRYIKQHIRGE